MKKLILGCLSTIAVLTAVPVAYSGQLVINGTVERADNINGPGVITQHPNSHAAYRSGAGNVERSNTPRFNKGLNRSSDFNCGYWNSLRNNQTLSFGTNGLTGNTNESYALAVYVKGVSDANGMQFDEAAVRYADEQCSRNPQEPLAVIIGNSQKWLWVW
ncbi:hypothetical protein TI04_10060 [Achromatium sp. WMS2]|nr:hypothetical protein TI04_10060 [Achromatium sp. WMS2]